MKFAQAAFVVPSRIRSIADLAEHHPGTLRLFYGEDSLPTPPFIKDAAHRAIDGDLTFYTPNAGYPALRRAISGQVARLHGVDLDPMGEVVVTASGMVALAPGPARRPSAPATRRWCSPRSGPTSPRPSGSPAPGPSRSHSPWPTPASASTSTGSRPPSSPTPASSPSPAPATRPPGPRPSTTGEALIDLCERRDLWLLADGVYERIVFDGPVAPSPLEIPGARARTIVAQSFSKTYRMTGWRVGYALAPPDLARSMTHLQEFVVSHAAGIAQEAARVAILEGEPFILESQARYARHRRIALDRFRGMGGVTVPDPTGAFYVFPRFDGLADSQDFCRWLVREKGVGLAPGNAFGLGGEGHIRLCFAVEEPILRGGAGPA